MPIPPEAKTGANIRMRFQNPMGTGQKDGQKVSLSLREQMLNDPLVQREEQMLQILRKKRQEELEELRKREQARWRISSWNPKR